MNDSSHQWSPGRSPAHRPLEHGEIVRRQRQQAACYVSACRNAAPRLAAAPALTPEAAPAASGGGLFGLLARWRRAA